MAPKRKLKSYSYGLKQKIVNDYESGMKIKEITDKLQMPRTTVSSVLKKRTKIMNVTDKMKKFKRIREAKYPELEASLMEFFDQCRNSNIPVSGKFIQETAKDWATDKGNY